MPELRMLWLEIDRDAMPTQLLRTDRPDRAKCNRAESTSELRADTLGLRDLYNVADLARAGEDDRVRFAIRNRPHRRPQWAAIHGQRPSIHRHRHHERAARLKSRDKIAIRDAVLLDRDTLTREISLRTESGEQFTPCIGFGNRDRWFEPQLAQGSDRLRPTRDRNDARKGRDDRGTQMAHLHHAEKLAHADAGQKNYDIEPTRDDPIGKLEGGLVVFERRLTHRRRNRRPPSVPFDHRGGLGRQPAFERNDTKAVEVCRSTAAGAFTHSRTL